VEPLRLGISGPSGANELRVAEHLFEWQQHAGPSI